MLALTCPVLDDRTAMDHPPGVDRYTVDLGRAGAPLLSEGEWLSRLRDFVPSAPWHRTVLAGGRLQVMDALLRAFSLRHQWAIPRLAHRLGSDLWHCAYYLILCCLAVSAVIEEHVFYVGMNKPHNNLGRLVDAWPLVVSHWDWGSDRWSPVTTGRWEPRHPQTRRGTEELELSGGVLFLGHQAEEELASLYSATSLFLFLWSVRDV